MINNKNDIWKTRRLKVNGSSIKTPILWHGTPIMGVPKPWLQIKDFQGLLVNAYEIKSKKSIQKSLLERELRDIINFNGPLIMDSGGFFFQKKGKMTVKPKEIVQIYEQCKPDIVVALDYPLNPNLSSNSDYYRLNKTKNNLKEMYDLLSSFDAEFMPVVHGYTYKQLEKSIRDSEKYVNKIVGIGSLVPLFRTTNGSSNVPRNKSNINTRIYAVNAVKKVRDYFSEDFLHVFGVGGSTTMHLMYLLGVDSIDTMGWRLKAAFGAIQLPGVPDRFLKPRKKRTLISESELKLFNRCKCPIHKDYTLEDINGNFQLRAIHNAYVYLEEVKKLHYILDNNLDIIDFFKERFSSSALGKIADHALNLISN